MLSKSDIEDHLDWLEFKYAFKPSEEHRENLCPIYKQIIISALKYNALPQEIEDDFKNKILSKIRL